MTEYSLILMYSGCVSWLCFYLLEEHPEVLMDGMTCCPAKERQHCWQVTDKKISITQEERGLSRKTAHLWPQSSVSEGESAQDNGGGSSMV